MKMKIGALRFGAALACGAAVALAQAPQDGKWSCQVDGRSIEMRVAGDTAEVALQNGEKFTLKLDPAASRAIYTDGKVALRFSGGGPASTRAPEWVRDGYASSILRCTSIP